MTRNKKIFFTLFYYFSLGFAASAIAYGDETGNETTSTLVKRIVGGTLAERGEFPFLLVVQRYSKSLGRWKIVCGASIISNEWALTAAHCTRQETASTLRVVAGEYDRRVDEKSELFISLSQIVSHHWYTGGNENYHDIALLKFSKPIVFNEYMQKIPLARAYSRTRGTVIVSGWGETVARGYSSRKPLKIELDIVDRAECKKIYKTLSINQICAGYMSEFRDACGGDSGGPLIQKSFNGKEFILVGIVSFGIGCGRGKNYPGVYINIPCYRYWIDSVINK